MSDNNQKKSLWARLIPTGKNAEGIPTCLAVNIDDLVHMDFSLAADGDKLNGETSSPRDIQTIAQNYLAKRASGDPSVRLIAHHTPEKGQEYLLPQKADRAPSV